MRYLANINKKNVNANKIHKENLHVDIYVYILKINELVGFENYFSFAGNVLKGRARLFVGWLQKRT